MRLTILSIIEMCLSNLQCSTGIDLMYNADMARCAGSRAQEHEQDIVAVEDATPFTTVAVAVVVQEIEQHEAVYQVTTRVSKKAPPAMLRRSEPYKARVRTLELARQSVVDGLRVHHKRDMGNVCKKLVEVIEDNTTAKPLDITKALENGRPTLASSGLARICQADAPETVAFNVALKKRGLGATLDRPSSHGDL